KRTPNPRVCISTSPPISPRWSPIISIPAASRGPSSMKILALFDVAPAVDPGEEFSPESLKEQDKPTEACVLECLTRLGHDVETLAVFDNVPAIVEKLTTYA